MRAAADAQSRGAVTPTVKEEPRRMTVLPTEYELRFAIWSGASGAEIMYFANPQDSGTTMRLSLREREAMASALSVPGFSAIARDDEPDRQLQFAL